MCSLVHTQASPTHAQLVDFGDVMDVVCGDRIGLSSNCPHDSNVRLLFINARHHKPRPLINQAFPISLVYVKKTRGDLRGYNMCACVNAWRTYAHMLEGAARATHTRTILLVVVTTPTSESLFREL